MKHLALMLFLGLMAISGYTQSFSLAHSNDLGGNIFAHTLKFDGALPNSVQDESGDTSSYELSIQGSIAYLKSIDGVQRATFDKATSTITIVSNELFDAVVATNSLNNLLKTSSHE